MKQLLVFLLVGMGASAYGQKYASEKSLVSFYSHATIEDIAAKNTKASSIFNVATGEIVFSIPIKDFDFAKSLMKEHFNEKYMNSEKIPKSTFQGTITGFQVGASGVQQAKATGKLTIHGITKDIDVPGTVELANGNVIVKSAFVVKLDDFKIARPQLLWQNIAEQVEVKIEFTYKPI
jgi:polyisoprenoid-binding protein YceI